MLSTPLPQMKSMLLTETTGHGKTAIHELSSKKSAENTLKISTNKSYNLDAGAYEGHLQNTRNSPANQHVRADGQNLLGTVKRIMIQQRYVPPSLFFSAVNFYKTYHVRNIKNGRYTVFFARDSYFHHAHI